MARVGDFDFYCKEVLSGKTKVDIVYESENVLAFYHTKPSYETHIVIIPKEHIHDLTKLTSLHNQMVLEIIQVAMNMTKNLKIKEKGARLITNMGKFQDTPHLHFHLISGKSIR